MTWADLAELWDERDARYRLRRREPLTERELATIVEYRRTELALLSSAERPLALSRLQQWSRPVGLA